MNAIPMIEPRSWRHRVACLALGLGLLAASAAASAQARLSLADLAAQIEALRGQVTTLTQANSNLQGQLDSLNANLGVVQATAQAAQSRAATVATDLAAVQANSVLALDGILAYDAAAQTARFSGVDVQVINGQGPNTINGRGNLIVGYNQPRTGAAICSKGDYDSPTGVACTANGGIFAQSHKSGSHNLVVGEGHAYSDYGGVLFGQNNAVTHVGGAALGGDSNVVRGPLSSVTGGMANEAGGRGAVVSAGAGNRASGSYSAIGGGAGNSADAGYSVVSGGRNRVVGWLQTYTWMGGGLSQPN
jgi:hypothetical protein